MEEIFDIKKILTELDKKNDSNYFIDFLHNDSFEAGLLKLSPGQKDIQGPHSVDEIYFVIEGNGFIKILQTDYKIEKGSCIFVPSNTKHYFHGNENELVVLYVFNVSNE
ncbi:cupin domain-containing protein [Candidatus Nitrosocosmicus hydrocola]|uniref:cupin domain-containing protein n=1 Tax=Candidatus Nitrosocosmicus hydrocola TaxID=1826872 RepID=UPI0011E58C5B|nr:cupin domain-containing protein [Candidatus Nitrosocosmicus hydrocola]